MTTDQFFAAIGKGDVHPRPEPDEVLWHDQKTRQLVGRSTPGYMCRDAEGKHTTDKHWFLP